MKIDRLVSIIMQTKITLRVHRSILDRVLDYCCYQDVSPDADDYYIVRFPFIENDYYYDIILSFGDRCECLAPPTPAQRSANASKTS